MSVAIDALAFNLLGYVAILQCVINLWVSVDRVIFVIGLLKRGLSQTQLGRDGLLKLGWSLESFFRSTFRKLTIAGALQQSFEERIYSSSFFALA